MHISVPVRGTFSSLMGDAAVDVVEVNACTTGKPHLKAKILQTFNEEERFGSSFVTSNIDNDDGSDEALGALEDYVNTKGLNYGQDSCALVSQPDFKGNHNTNTQNMPGRFDCAASKKMPFIPPAISVELVRKQSEKDSQIERGNRNRPHGTLSPDWGSKKEERLYENQNSASVRAAKSLSNFKDQEARQQPLYVNNNQVLLMKKKKSGEDFSKNQQMPDLPIKQKLRRTDGFGAQTKTWEKGRSPNYENFLGGDCVGGSWHRGAMYQKNKNKAHLIGQGAKGSNLKDDTDYENVTSVGEDFLPRKTQKMSTSSGSQDAPKVTLLESRRRGAGFSREDNKAVRRSRSNVEAMLKPPDYGQGVVESRENISSENRQTNTESLMHLLGLPMNSSCSDQVQTFEDDDYLPMDDYDDNRA